MRRILAVFTAVTLAACSDRPNPLQPAPDLASTAAGPGFVFTMTNGTGGNAILRFDRGPDGGLAPAGEVSTGGFGTGAGLGNQGGLTLGANGRALFAVNAGDNTVSVLAVRGGDLELVDVVPSGGERPISVTTRGRLVYVLNAGGAGSITGFVITPGEGLVALPGSTRPLSGATMTDAAQVSFSPNGRVLAVTEKATNLLVTYVVGADGRPGDPRVFASAGMTPFGFSFDPHGRLIVSEAFGGAPDASAVSSYAVSSDGALSGISASVGTTETAACWIIVTPGGRFAYTTNTASGSISGYAVAPDGSLGLLDDDGVTGVTGMGSGPIDLALSRDGRFLYSLNSGNGTLSGFHVAADGRLLSIGTVEGIPGGANGLVAR
jgi:6-phosphogluconolactonase (cycloisomerase 2 family)